MTLDSTTSKVQYTQSGTTTEWPVTFKFLDNEDLIVITTVSGVDTTLVLDTDYTVDGAGDDAGGTVTISPAVASGTRVTIYRVIDLDQPTELTTAGGWYPQVHESVFDRLTMQIQQVNELAERSLRLGVTSTQDPETAVDDVFTARDDAQAAAAAAEDSAEAAQVAASSVGSASESGTLTSGQDTITLTNAYDHVNGAAAVYLDGVKQAKSTLTFTDAYTITLGGAVTEDTTWEVVSLSLAGESAMTAIRDAAIAAKDDAETAQAAAEQAETNAELAEANAEAAQAAAEAARDAALAAGRVLQKVTATSTSTFSITAQIPSDTSVPQSTEGTEFFSTSFTPQRAGSKILVTLNFWGIGDNADCAVALFHSGSSDAIAARRAYGTYGWNASIVGEFTAASTSPVTISARGGRSGASGTMYVNRTAAATVYGAASTTTMTIEEIAA